MSKPMNTMLLKELNRKKVVSVLFQMEMATILELSQLTALSTVTVGTIINECIESGEVLEAKLTASQGGRPARAFRGNPDFYHGLIIFGHLHQGQDRMFYRIINRYGVVTQEWMGEEETITRNDVEDAINKALRKDPLIRGIGFGLPGVEFQGKMQINDYEGLKGIAMSDYFSQQYRMPVFVENDVNLAVMGYQDRQKEGVEDCVYLYFPGKYPPGAGVIIRGELYKGRDSYVGEVNGLSHRLDWERFREANRSSKIQLIKPLIQDISVWLNPDCLVLAGDGIDENFMAHLHGSLDLMESKVFLPRVEISVDFDLDFERGLAMKLRYLLEEERWKR